MDFGEKINMLPLRAVFLFTLAFCICAVEAGTFLARISLRYREEKEPEAALGSTISWIFSDKPVITDFAVAEVVDQGSSRQSHHAFSSSRIKHSDHDLTKTTPAKAQ